MSLRMGFLNALTPVQGCLLYAKQGRRSESLGPHPGSEKVHEAAAEKFLAPRPRGSQQASAGSAQHT